MNRMAVIVLILMMVQPVISNVFVFNVERGSDKNIVQWNIVHKDNGAVELVSLNKLERASHHLVCDSTLNTLEWRFQKQQQKTDYTVRVEGKALVIKGSIDGKPIHKKVEREGLPWYQFHAISLPPHLDSNFVELKFISIRPDDGKVFKLTAQNGGMEKIIVNGETVMAIRIDVHVAGLLSNFGHVSYWFRSTDHIFLKYKGISGFPGTRPVTYELIKAES